MGPSPVMTIIIAAREDSSNISSEAYWYTYVASVSKLNSHSNKVMGNSFKISTNTRIPPTKIFV